MASLAVLINTSANAVISVLPEHHLTGVDVNESIDEKNALGYYSVTNNTSENLWFVAISHTNSHGAESTRTGFGAVTATEEEWNAGSITAFDNVPFTFDSTVYNFDNFFGTTDSVVNIYFAQDNSAGIVSGETTGNQFSYRALFIKSNVLALGKSGQTYGGSVSLGSPSAVPIPAAVWLFSSGLVGLMGFRKTKNKA